MKLLHHYFADSSYGLIYLHHFFRNIATAAMYVFTGAYFLKLGMPLHFVLLFYGLEFGLRGVLSPFGLVFFNKVGLIRALVVSKLLFMLFFIGLSFADQNLLIGFSSLVLAAIGGAIYYPFLGVLEAFYVEEHHHRTKQLSMGTVMIAFGNVVGAAGVGFLLTGFGFNWVVVFVAASLALSVVPFLWLGKTFPPSAKLRAKDVYAFMLDTEFKPLWQPFFGQQLMIIARRVMIPVFIFSIVGELDTLGYLVALALVVENICTLVSGHYTDRLGVARTVRFSTRAYGLAMLIYVFLAKTPFTLFLAESYQKTVSSVYDAAFASGMHRHAKDKHPDRLMLFGAAWQMALCFGEILVLPLYALLAYFIGMNVFYLSCAAAVGGIWMVHRYFQRA